MDWPTLTALIIQVGLPTAMRIAGMAKQGGTVTTEQWDELKALVDKTYEDYIEEARRPALPGALPGT